MFTFCIHKTLGLSYYKVVNVSAWAYPSPEGPLRACNGDVKRLSKFKTRPFIRLLFLPACTVVTLTRFDPTCTSISISSKSPTPPLIKPQIEAPNETYNRP